MTEDKLMDNIFNILIVVITFTLGIFATVIRDWLIQRREKKRINQLFIDFFNSLTMLEHPLKARMRAMILLQRMGKELILEKLSMMYNEHYRARDVYEDDLSFVSEEFPVIKKTAIVERDVQYFEIRLDNESWNLILFLKGMYITDTTKKPISKNQFIFFEEDILPKSNENTLIEFLKFLQETYKETGIIKKSKKLLHGKVTFKIKKVMDELRENKK